MKKLAIVSFTPAGNNLGEQICRSILEAVHTHKPGDVKAWCQDAVEWADALVFIGAMGIAVRTIAPFIKSKTTDPAVLVIDEQGKYVISVLSGHLGGGNELTRSLAQLLAAEPVITTSSDVQGKIAIDVFAKKNRLHIADMGMAKKVAAAIVAGEPVSFSCQGKVFGKVPEELTTSEQEAVVKVVVGTDRAKFPLSAEASESDGTILWLIPRAYVLGIGCKKGKTAKEINAAVTEVLREYDLPIESLAAIATIDLKQDEPGLLQFCQASQIPLVCYSASQLQEVEGKISPSEFVVSVTGVDNVCERAAVRWIMEHQCQREQEQPAIQAEDCLVLRKVKKQGITIALAKIDWSVEFE